MNGDVFAELCKGSRISLPFKAHWLIHMPPDLALRNSAFSPNSVFMYFMWISKQTAIIFLYDLKWWDFVTETECVYCAVNIIRANCTFMWFRSPRKMMPNTYYKRNCNTAVLRILSVKYSRVISYLRNSVQAGGVFSCSVMCCQPDFLILVFYYKTHTNIMSLY